MGKKLMMNLLIRVLCFFLVITLPFSFVRASEFDRPISNDEKQLFREMFKPVFKIYDLFKYATLVLGGVYLAYGSLLLLVSGGGDESKTKAKNTMAATVMALIIIWSIPYFLDFMVSI